MPDIHHLLALATDRAVSARQRVRAACAVLDAFKSPKPTRATRRPVARSRAELQAELESLRAQRGQPGWL